MVDTGVLLDRASLLLEQGRVHDAEVAAREVLSREPYNDAALALLGRCAYEGGHFKDGMGFISEALALRPEHSFYYYLLAFGHYQLGEYATAVDYLATAQSIHPDVAEYYGLQSFVLLAQQQWEPALEKANEGLYWEADNLTCLNARSRALNKLRRNGEAIETMQDALALDPHNEMTHATVAWNYLEKGSHKEAQHHFREALRLNPNSDNARTGLKEALKSNVAPYRWLLQYHFWLHNKGKKWRTGSPIVTYILFRLASAGLSAAGAPKELVFLPIGIYLLLVITSWTINPIANFVLLFHPLGKHAISSSEKWSAITVVSAMVSGLTLLGLGLFTNLFDATAYTDTIFFGALTLLTLALPLGELPYPLRWRGTVKSQKIALALVALGAIAFAGMFFLPGSLVLFTVYLVGFIIYNWTGLFR